MKIRDFPKNNYKAIFTNTGRTLHLRYDDTQPITELEYPEIFDVCITSRCYGKCKWCYISAMSSGKNYKDIVKKAKLYFGNMTKNQRPNQLAIGGCGEPTLHPDFIPFLKTVKELGIMPNYTTNAMHLSDEIVEATKQYAGGVAISTHPHLEKIWRKGIVKLTNAGIRTNLHIVISTKEMVDQFLTLREEFGDIIEYFVLLPYQSIGRAKLEPELKQTYQYLFDNLTGDISNVAWGAGFYDELLHHPEVKADLYDHGVLSKYLDMKGNMTLFNSSYEWETPLKENLLKGEYDD